MALVIEAANGSTKVDELLVEFKENTGNAIVVATIRGLDPNLTYEWGVEGSTTLNGGGRYQLVPRMEGTTRVLDIVTVVPSGASDVFNYEGTRRHDIKIVGRNGGTILDEGDFSFQMQDVNEAPTNIRLGNQTASIEVVEGTNTFGALTSDDQDDSGFEFLIHDFGFAPNGNPDSLFDIVGNDEIGYSLVLAAGKTLDYESNTIQTEAGTGRKFYDVIINVTDGGGIVNGGAPLTTPKAFRIYVTNNPGDDPPTNQQPQIGGTVAQVGVADNGGAASLFGGLTITDDTTTANFTATVTFTGGAGTLNTGGVGRLEGNTYTVTGTRDAVRDALRGLTFDPTDNPSGAVGATSDTTFTVTVSDGSLSSTSVNTVVRSTVANRTPTGVTINNAGSVEVQENGQANRSVGTLAGVDSNQGDTFTYEIVNPNGMFSISGNQLHMVGSFDYEGQGYQTDGNGRYFVVQVRARDQGGNGVWSPAVDLRVYVTDDTSDNNVPPSLAVNTTAFSSTGG